MALVEAQLVEWQLLTSVTRLGDWTFGHFLKSLATINLPKSPTFLGNYCKGVKSIIFLVKSHLGNFYRNLAIFFWLHWQHWLLGFCSECSNEIEEFLRTKIPNQWLPPQLRGFVSNYHLAVTCSNPKHTIYAFSICIIEIVWRK